MDELQLNNSLTKGSSVNPSIQDIADHNNETREVRQISGQAQFAKPSVFKRFMSGIISVEDINDLGTTIMDGIVKPSIRSGIMNSIISAATMVFGGARPNGYYGGYSNYRPYNNISGASWRGSDRYDNSPQYDQYGYRINRDDYYSIMSYRDVEFITYKDALDAIDELYFQLQNYHMVRVSDYFSTARLTGDPQSNNWGWYELPQLIPIPKFNGRYKLDLPKPVPIKK